jgi:KTSC domain-containing protein
MTLITVSSSAIRAVGYDGYILSVEFHSGRVYDHPGVPESVFQELMDATSKGSYYARYIRGRYR